MNVHVQAEPEKVIATSEGIELRGRGKVKLTITERRIIVEKKGPLFPNRFATAIILDYSQINGIAQEGNSSIKVNYTENSKPASITLVAKSSSSALSIMNQVLEILQTGKKRFEEEAEKKRKEEMDDTLFVIYLFESMINVWAMVSPVREMLSAMGQGEWDKVEVHAKSILTAAEELIRDAETNLGQAMADFSEAIKSRSPLVVNEKVSALFVELGTTVNSRAPISKKWAQYTRETYPNWSSLAYFLLFALGVNQMLVGSELSKQKEVDEAISRIRRILPVIEIKIGKYFVDSFDDAIRAKDPFSVPQKISNLLLDEIGRAHV